MTSLSARLEQRDWLRDWPRQAVDDFDRSGMRLEGDTTHDRIQVICQAAFGAGEMEVTLQEVHGLLDRLDAWNGRHASALTWPTTTEGFLKALARDIEAGHDDVRLMRVLVPGMSDRAQRYAAAQSSPPSVSAPHSQPPTPVAPEHPAQRLARDSATTSRPSASPALAVKLLEIVNNNPGGIASEKIDAHIKSAISSSASSDPAKLSSERFRFFVKDLMPSIAMLEPGDIHALMKCWPATASVDIARPESLLSRSDFWVSMKAGGPESRIAIISHVLPRIFNGQEWGPQKSLEALQQMMARVRSPEEFSRRLDLWHAWGGNLDAPIIHPGSDSGNDFSQAAIAPTTARSWIQEAMPAHVEHLPPVRRPKGP